MATAEKIIEALGKHTDSEAVNVLEELGTNCPLEKIREQTLTALIRRNTHDSLKVVLMNKGKGINDLNPSVAMVAVNEILSLSDKSEVLRIIEDTIKMHSDEEIQNTAKSLKTLITLSN
jgi:hypothetical protein